jgi:hypothetical protein
MSQVLPKDVNVEALVEAHRRRLATTICAACKTPAYPRGFCRSRGLCWTCTFPTVGPT